MKRKSEVIPALLILSSDISRKGQYGSSFIGKVATTIAKHGVLAGVAFMRGAWYCGITAREMSLTYDNMKRAVALTGMTWEEFCALP